MLLGVKQCEKHWSNASWTSSPSAAGNSVCISPSFPVVSSASLRTHTLFCTSASLHDKGLFLTLLSWRCLEASLGAIKSVSSRTGPTSSVQASRTSAEADLDVFTLSTPGCFTESVCFGESLVGRHPDE